MTTAEQVLEKALAHASVQTSTEDAVDDLLSSSPGNRVAFVRARQELVKRSEANPDDSSVVRASELLDEALRRGTWDVS
jgi:hypothetical protein